LRSRFSLQKIYYSNETTTELNDVYKLYRYKKFFTNKEQNCVCMRCNFTEGLRAINDQENMDLVIVSKTFAEYGGV
jgi:predicted nucleic acid-binding protein